MAKKKTNLIINSVRRKTHDDKPPYNIIAKDKGHFEFVITLDHYGKDGADHRCSEYLIKIYRNGMNSFDQPDIDEIGTASATLYQDEKLLLFNYIKINNSSDANSYDADNDDSSFTENFPMYDYEMPRMMEDLYQLSHVNVKHLYGNAKLKRIDTKMDKLKEDKKAVLKALKNDDN